MRRLGWLSIAVFSVSLYGQEPVLKNFREIYESMISTTGLPVSTNLTAIYNTVKEMLPKQGQAEEMTPSTMMAVTRLSAAFCRTLIDTDAGKAATARRAHKMVDFTKGPKDLTEDIRKSIVEEYAGLFWQDAPTDTEVQAMLTVMEAIGSKAKDDATGTRKTLLGACTAALASVDFLTL